MSEPISDEELARTRNQGAWSNSEKLRLIARIDAEHTDRVAAEGERDRYKVALEEIIDERECVNYYPPKSCSDYDDGMLRTCQFCTALAALTDGAV